MKKTLLSLAALCAVVCSCSEVTPSQEEQIDDRMVPIAFDNYVTSSTTRATSLNLDSILVKGFGVFAFQQDQTPMEKYVKENFMPNFMYNQKVVHSFETWKWEYSPVKYWPNNTGAMVSFFAYAPYIEAFNPSGDLNADDHTLTPETNTFLQKVEPTAKEGLRLILGYDYGGPGIEYTIPSDPRNGVDLMWGEYCTNGQSNYCAKDLTKPDVDQKILFIFKHALSRIAFKVKVYTDEVRTDDNALTPSNPLAENTTIYIKKVTLKGSLPGKGTLRLCDGTWNIDKEDCQSVLLDTTQFTDNIKSGLKGSDAVNDIPLLLGIDDAPKNNYLTLIPGASFNIEIVYDVVTLDPANPRNSSIVTNTMLSDEVFTLQQGYAYMFHLNIGMTTVKFNCNVYDWQTGDVITDVDLPANTTPTH